MLTQKQIAMSSKNVYDCRFKKATCVLMFFLKITISHTAASSPSPPHDLYESRAITECTDASRL